MLAWLPEARSAPILAWIALGCQAPRDSAATASTEDAGSLPLPNLVIVFLDDAGYADFRATGAPYPTPHVDRLVEEGTLFTSFHVAQPVCSASRVALLTGCYADRVGVTGALSPDDAHGLADGEVTLAELAKSQGYRTAAFGKWHLGDDAPFMPTQHGFDEFAGLPYSHDMWPVRSDEYPDLPFYEGRTKLIEAVTPQDQKQLTVRFTEYATEFIERNAAQPFFLYLAHPQPHVPLFVSDGHDGASGRGLYADVMTELDWSLGEILSVLDERGIAERTWVIFTSDNGPWLSYGNHAGSAVPFREGKHTVFEGGTRVFAAMRFPGEIPAGRVVDTPLMTIDVFPTFARRIGAELPDHPIDGRDVFALLAQENDAASPHDAYFFWYENRVQAVSSGRFKLHLEHTFATVGTPGSDGQPGTLDIVRQGLVLYDLELDPGESVDVSERHPDVVEGLVTIAEEHERALLEQAREPGRLE